MNKRNRYRDQNFAAYVEQIEVALDDQLFTVSPVVDAVKRLHDRLRRRSAPRAQHG